MFTYFVSFGLEAILQFTHIGVLQLFHNLQLSVLSESKKIQSQQSHHPYANIGNLEALVLENFLHSHSFTSFNQSRLEDNTEASVPNDLLICQSHFSLQVSSRHFVLSIDNVYAVIYNAPNRLSFKTNVLSTPTTHWFEWRRLLQ